MFNHEFAHEWVLLYRLGYDMDTTSRKSYGTFMFEDNKADGTPFVVTLSYL